MKDKNEIRFILDDNSILVYNYYYKKWSRIPFSVKDGEIYKGRSHIINSQGFLFRETNEVPTAPIISELKTGWISFNTQAGYKKIKAVRLILEGEGIRLMQCAVSYNFEEDVSEILDLTEEKFSVRNQDTPSAFGNRNMSDVRNLRFLPRIQKCNSIRLSFSFYAQRIKVTNIQFEYFATDTIGRLPVATQT